MDGSKDRVRIEYGWDGSTVAYVWGRYSTVSGICMVYECVEEHEEDIILWHMYGVEVHAQK